MMGQSEAPPFETRLAELLASRLCHDLASPVGAVLSGLELIEEFEDETADDRGHGGDTFGRDHGIRIDADEIVMVKRRNALAPASPPATGMDPVEAVLTDVDNRTVLAVTIDQDPAADLHRWYGRYLYYALDEVEIVAGGAG